MKRPGWIKAMSRGEMERNCCEASPVNASGGAAESGDKLLDPRDMRQETVYLELEVPVGT